MKYAILIESKNRKIASLECIAQIINPSVDLEAFSLDDIKLKDIISNVLCPLLSMTLFLHLLPKQRVSARLTFTLSHLSIASHS